MNISFTIVQDEQKEVNSFNNLSIIDNNISPLDNNSVNDTCLSLCRNIKFNCSRLNNNRSNSSRRNRRNRSDPTEEDEDLGDNNESIWDSFIKTIIKLLENKFFFIYFFISYSTLVFEYF